jgi:lysophospholipase L1-like esterase
MPARVLIIGDSVTQGAVGDPTWRLHLWRLLRKRHRAVDFVGPRTGEYDDRGTADPGDDDFDDDTRYPDPDFDHDHAATWGGSMGHREGDFDIADLLVTCAPDVVVNAEGYNDLTFWNLEPRQLVDLMARFVADVRAARPGAAVVLGQLVQRWAPGVTEYNALLVDLAAALDAPGSRVVVALAPDDFAADAHTRDGVHPSPAGEVRIAEQYADALLALDLPTDEPSCADPGPETGLSRR